MKKYIDATQKILNTAYANSETSAPTPGNSVSMEDIKKTVLPVKDTHRYYYVVSENLTNDYKA